MMAAMTFFADLAVRATVLLACAGLLTLALRRASASWRHLVWSGALIGVLLMPFVMLLGPTWAVPVLPATPSSAAVPAAPPVPVTTTLATPPLALQNSAVLPPVAAVALHVSDALAAPPSPDAVAIGAWLLGLSLLAGWLLIGLVRLRRLARRGRRLDEAPWRAALDEARHRLSMTRAVTLLTGVGTPVPLTWGTFRPVVLLPDNADNWPPERRLVVLLHELAHVRRFDCLAQTLGRLARAIHWFNPLAWLAVGQLARERERACDELVLACGTRASDYAQHLLSFARPDVVAGWPGAVAMPMARSSQLERRLRTILKPRVPRPPRGVATPVLVTLAVAGLVFAVSTAQPAARTAISTPEAPIATAPQAPRPAPRPVVAAPLAPAPAAAVPAVSAPVASMPAHAAPPSSKPATTPATPATPAAPASPAAPPAPAARPAAPTTPVDAPNVHVNFDISNAHLMAELKDPDPDVRARAAILLGLTDAGPAGIAALLRAAKDPDAQVRGKAVIALGLQGNRRAFHTLLAALKDPDAQVREKAAFALAVLGDHRALGALRHATHDKDPQVQEAARTAVTLLKLGAPHGVGAERLTTTVLSPAVTRKINRSIQRALRALKPLVACNGSDNCAVHINSQDLAAITQGATSAAIGVAGSVVTGVVEGVTEGLANSLPQLLQQLDNLNNLSSHTVPKQN